MRPSRTLKKLRSGRIARICGMGHFLPPMVRLAAAAGFDCIWLDLEHRSMDSRELTALLALFRLYDIDCLLRAPTREPTRLYRYLEDGASGLMIPHVADAEQARRLVQAVKFPPLGNRGLDGCGLDNDYGADQSGRYPAEANRETFLVVQIESVQAVEQAEAIAAVEGVAGLFVGPGDLGLRLQHDGQRLGELPQAIERVAQAAARHGKAWGLPAGSADLLRSYAARGAQLLAFGGEVMALRAMLQDHGQQFERVEQETCGG